MALVGLAATFLPQEILGHFGIHSHVAAQVAVQIMGALYLGFAMLNWMARANLIGGIYSRPVAVGNVLHFSVAALALIKAMMTTNGEPVVVTAAVIYSAFALLFARVLLVHPADAN